MYIFTVYYMIIHQEISDTSRKSYGMLQDGMFLIKCSFWQIKDISLTPYSEQQAVFPANPELDGPNAILENVGIVGGLIGDAIPGMGVPVAEDDVVLQDVVSNSSLFYDLTFYYFLLTLLSSFMIFTL